MSLNKSVLGDQGLLDALHVPETLSGVVGHLATSAAWLNAAALVWNKHQYAGWLSVTKSLSRKIREAAEQQPTLAATWFQPPSSNIATADRIRSWPRSVTPGPTEVRLNAMLGHAAIVEAHRGGKIASTLIDGAYTLRNASLKLGRQSLAWHELSEIDFLNPATLTAFVKTHGPDTPCNAFAVAALAILQLPAPAPALEKPSSASSAPDSNQKQTESPSPRVYRQDFENSTSEEEKEASTIDAIPDISKRIAAADYASVAAKLGLVDRDYLPPDELARVTKKLMNHLEGKDSKKSFFALFGLISLLTSMVDFIAVNLKFSCNDSVWLDLRGGAWCWDFRSYRAINDEQASAALQPEPITTHLPQSIASRLREMSVQFPTAETVGQLFSAAMGSEFDLTAFRVFLRGCGGDVHPIYRGRFARSLGITYLHVTKSDMSCALQAGSFSATAPAALFYFGPKVSLLHARTQKVYSFLGLGNPALPANQELRLGCQKILKGEKLQIGWQGLCKSITDQLPNLRNAKSDFERRTIANQLMPLLCSGFVIQSAHRGTRIERLTVGHIFTSEEFMLIMDKVDQEREQPRLIAKTNAIKQFFAIAWDCHQLIAPATRDGINHDVPLFKSWNIDPEYVDPGPLTTADIAPVIQAHFFGSDTNFARSTWVTSLDEAACDRWLVRVLTGHTRDVTRTNGSYMDIPVIEAARRLGDEMERVGVCIFGPTHLATHISSPQVNLCASPRAIRCAMPGDQVPDPRTLLDPLDVNAIFGWKVATEIRKGIFAGGFNTTSSALALLQMLFVDFSPEVELCLSAIKNPSAHLQPHGDLTGLVWHRPHFAHPTWIPLQPTTMRTLTLAHRESYSVEQICEQAHAALQQLHPSYWPQLPQACAQALQNTALHYMRLTLPPSLLAANALRTPGPTLSKLSLARLAQDQTPSVDPRASTRHGASSKSHRERTRKDSGLKPLKDLIFRFSDSKVRLGELRKRSIDCLKEVHRFFTPQTFFEVWILDWVVDELNKSIRDDDGRLVISSLDTYLGVLIAETKATKQNIAVSDPYEWEEDEWQFWISELLITFGFTPETGPPNLATEAAIAPIPDRIRHPLQRLIDSLHRRNFSVPTSIRKWILQQTDPVVTGSASSVLISQEDFDRVIEIGESWMKQNPLDAALFRSRAQIQLEVPTRSAELSNLKIRCLTDSNQLVIERVGYLNLKTELSVRLSFISDELKALLTRTSQIVTAHVPSAKFLFRLDGSASSGARDQEIISALSSALKVATRDATCRPHSLRAMALQNHAWPGWVEHARLLLTTCTSPAVSAAWVQSLQGDWCGLSFAFVQAGHSDMRSALGNYLAGARLVLGIHAHAQLNDLKIGPSFLKSLGIDPAAMRQARRRGGETFDPWVWLHGHLSANNKLILKEDGDSNSPNHKKAVAGPTNDSSSSTLGLVPNPLTIDGEYQPHYAPDVDIDRQIQFLSARLLDMGFPAAMEYAGVNLGTANALEALIPDVELLSIVSRRSRSAPQLRGHKGNLNVLASPLGSEILDWLKGLTGRDRLTLFNLVFKVRGIKITAELMIELFNALTIAIPEELALNICRGSRHITPAEVRTAQSLGNKIALTASDDIGVEPVIKINPRPHENRVMASRVTSVFRAVLLAFFCLEVSRRPHD